MVWKFGQYIEQLLEEKGGRRSGWHQKRLAEESNLSAPYIGWLIRGETSGKKGPPEISVDTLIKLSRALNIQEQKLIEVYKGEDPDRAASCQAEWQQLEPYLLGLVQHLPKRLIAQAIIQQEGKEKVREWVMDILNEKEPGRD